MTSLQAHAALLAGREKRRPSAKSTGAEPAPERGGKDTLSVMLAEAERRCAITLMRLCEALEQADADLYSDPVSRRERRSFLHHHYRAWFSRVARSPGSVSSGEVAEAGNGGRATTGRSSA